MKSPLFVDDPSPARRFVRRLVAELGIDGAHEAIDAMLGQLTVQEVAALEADWPFWARSKQLPPPDPWRTWGFLTGRGFGKTLAISSWINREVEDGRVRQVGVAAQDEDNTVEVNILGPAGLIASAPPWFKPEYESGAKKLWWPNGATALVRTPEVPGKIRGPEYDLAWLSELQSWPLSKREEAYSNFRLSTRIGLARTVWDSTPKRGHEILKELLADAAQDPTHHYVVRGSTYENVHALADGYIEGEERRIGGTRRGREELEGEVLPDSESATVKDDWIVERRMPDQLVRRVLSIDAATTSRAGSDLSGIIDAGIDRAGHVFILGDYTEKLPPEEYGALLVDKYFEGRCDCIVVETNKVGDHVTSTLRLVAKGRARVTVLDDQEKDPLPPRHRSDVIHVREIYSRGPKEERAADLSTAYERKRVYHVIGRELTELKKVLTTWEPRKGMRSPDRLDAEVHAVKELLGLEINKPDPKTAFKGLREINKAIGQPSGSGVASDLARRLVARRETV